MLQKIAQLTGLPFNESDPVALAALQRINFMLPAGTTEDHPALAALVRAAEEDLDRQGQRAMDALVNPLTAPPPEKVFKIKRSPKGARIKVAAANGVRFSFGPVWNESVKKGKGIALVPANRAKLNHQALLAGIANPEAMEVGALCAALAETL